MRCRHLIALARLHLRLRPVDRVDLRARSLQRAEKAVARAFIDLIKMVFRQVVEHCAIPAQRLLAWEMTFDHHAAATFDQRALRFCYTPGSDIGIVQLRPDGFAACFYRLNLFHALANTRAELIEELLYIANLRPQRLFHLTDGGFVVGRKDFMGKRHKHLFLSFESN